MQTETIIEEVEGDLCLFVCMYACVLACVCVFVCVCGGGGCKV